MLDAAIDLSIAEKVLDFFVAASESDWQEAIKSVEDDENIIDSVVERVTDIVGLHDWQTPVGAYLGSYASVKDIFEEHEYDDAIAAVRFLKEQDRIVQLGRGRGKAIIVINNDPLSLDDEPIIPTTATAEVIATSTQAINPDHALEIVRETFSALLAERDELKATVQDLRMKLKSVIEATSQ